MRVKTPTRIKYYKLAKDSGEDVPWIRVADVKKLRYKRPVVLVNGTFDLMHSGHFKILFHARKHGKTVIVAMDSDQMVASKKPGRPIQTWVERSVAFRYMPVDYLVEINSDEEFVELVKLLKPNLRVKGSEQRDNASRVPNVPCLFVHDAGQRTSSIVQRIKTKVQMRVV